MTRLEHLVVQCAKLILWAHLLLGAAATVVLLVDFLRLVTS